QIYSEASIGKASLRQMRVRSWRKLQPDFPPETTGIIMSTYYGGRSEVRMRREITRVEYCDFLSMYPTVCTLMKLWPYVIATGIDAEDATADTKAFVGSVTAADLQRRETWEQLSVLVQVAPRGDVFPVRS